MYLIELIDVIALITGYLGVLGDLNHSNPFVRQTLLTWVREMVQNYSSLVAACCSCELRMVWCDVKRMVIPSFHLVSSRFTSRFQV